MAALGWKPEHVGQTSEYRSNAASLTSGRRSFSPNPPLGLSSRCPMELQTSLHADGKVLRTGVSVSGGIKYRASYRV